MDLNTHIFRSFFLEESWLPAGSTGSAVFTLSSRLLCAGWRSVPVLVWSAWQRLLARFSSSHSCVPGVSHCCAPMHLSGSTVHVRGDMGWSRHCGHSLPGWEAMQRWDVVLLSPCRLMHGSEPCAGDCMEEGSTEPC